MEMEYGIIWYGKCNEEWDDECNEDREWYIVIKENNKTIERVKGNLLDIEKVLEKYKLDDFDYIEVNSIMRPLGRKYGNSYGTYITFEKNKKGIWVGCLNRYSNTWGVWMDIGMSGSATDGCFIYNESEMHDIFERIKEGEDVGNWDLEDITMSECNCDYSIEDGDFLKILSDMDNADICVYIWSGSEGETILLESGKVLNDEDKKKLIEELENYWYNVDDELKEEIMKVKTIEDLLNLVS